MTRTLFQPAQARAIADAFEQRGVQYLFIGTSAAILLGFPAMTQDVHIFPARTPENGQRIIAALASIGFALDDKLKQAIVACLDFVQIKSGPFDVDLVFAPDGIANFAEAKERSILLDGFRIANLRDIISSKRASGREKDLIDLQLLERFRQEFEKQNTPPLRSAKDITGGPGKKESPLE